jgi:hypothetical protein
VSSLAYYLLWLAGGLLIVAIISATIASHLKRRVMRRLKGEQLLDALARYSEWVAAQRAMSYFTGELNLGSPLQEIRDIGEQWFPDLSAEAGALFAVHERVVAFVSAQQRMRLQDPEAWLELDHEARFMELWRAHLSAVHTLAARLKLVFAVVSKPPTDACCKPLQTDG